MAGINMTAPANAPNGTTLPATCSAGDIFVKTNATSGQQWYVCESANNWVQQGGSGSVDAILNQDTLQSGATFYVSSGTVKTFNNVDDNSTPWTLYDADSVTKAIRDIQDLPITFGIPPQTPYISDFMLFVEDDDNSGAYELMVSTMSDARTNALSRRVSLTMGAPSTDRPYGYLHYRFGQGGVFDVKEIFVAESSMTFTGINLYIPSLSATNEIYAEDVVGSGSGAYGYAGSTLTFDAPPIDAIDRMMVVNNGNVSFPEIATGVLTEGGTAGSTFTMTAALVHTGSVTVTAKTDCSNYTTDGQICWDTDDNKLYMGNGSGVTEIAAGSSTQVSLSTGVTGTLSGSNVSGGTFGAVNGSALTSLTAANISAGNLGASVMASSAAASVIRTGISAGSNITLTNTNAGVQIAASGSGGWTSTAESNLAMTGYAITGISSATFTNGDGTDWTTYGSTTAMLFTTIVAADGATVTPITIPVAANSTYSVTGSFLIDPTSGSSGVKAIIDLPDGTGSLVDVHLWGSNNSALAFRSDEGLFTDNTAHSNAFVTYNAGEGIVNLAGRIVTGDAGGTASFKINAISGCSIWTGSQITMVKQ